MESCACAHEQQVRHLKSRVSQLEIMLDKAHKRINAQAQSAVSPPTNSPMPFPRSISSNDVRRSDEYRRLQADLESEKRINTDLRSTVKEWITTSDVEKAKLDHEKRIKMDLMANLKELTTTKEAEKASLEQELAEVKAQHEGTLNILDEIQEEFDRCRSVFAVGLPNAADSTIQAASTEYPQDKDASRASNYIDSDARISASVIRSFTTEMERKRVARTRSTLQQIIQRVPEEWQGKVSAQDNETLEMQLLDCIGQLSRDHLDKTAKDALRRMFAGVSETDDSMLQDADAKTLVRQASAVVTARFDSTDTLRSKLIDSLYRTVPAALEDLFNLLSSTSSFVYPEKPAPNQEVSTDVFDNYLQTTCSNLSRTIRKYISSHQKSRQKISYRGFTAGDLALFLPTRNANSPAWAAFNVGAPHYFLAMDGVDTDGKDFLIGRIQEIVEKTGEPGVDSVSTVAGVADVRKWWEVKILEKKKVIPT